MMDFRPGHKRSKAFRFDDLEAFVPKGEGGPGGLGSRGSINRGRGGAQLQASVSLEARFGASNTRIPNNSDASIDKDLHSEISGDSLSRYSVRSDISDIRISRRLNRSSISGSSPSLSSFKTDASGVSVSRYSVRSLLRHVAKSAPKSRPTVPENKDSEGTPTEADSLHSSSSSGLCDDRYGLYRPLISAFSFYDQERDWGALSTTSTSEDGLMELKEPLLGYDSELTRTGTLSLARQQSIHHPADHPGMPPLSGIANYSSEDLSDVESLSELGDYSLSPSSFRSEYRASKTVAPIVRMSDPPRKLANWGPINYDYVEDLNRPPSLQSSEARSLVSDMSDMEPITFTNRPSAIRSSKPKICYIKKKVRWDPALAPEPDTAPAESHQASGAESYTTISPQQEYVNSQSLSAAYTPGASGGSEKQKGKMKAAPFDAEEECRMHSSSVEHSGSAHHTYAQKRNTGFHGAQYERDLERLGIRLGVTNLDDNTNK